MKLDDAALGFLYRVLTAAPARQSIFTALAARDVVCGFNGDDGLADIIRHGRPINILRHAYGNVPTGLLGVLERIYRPLDHAGDYNRLYGLLAGSDQRVAEALRTCVRINRSKLKMLTPQVWLLTLNEGLT